MKTFRGHTPIPLFFAFPQRAMAALRAIFERCAGVKLRAVALPPLRPSETAAGFFLFAIVRNGSTDAQRCAKKSAY